MDLINRRACVDATLARFSHVPFKWGVNDCARMAVFHLKQMGHKVPLAKSGSYGSAMGAVRALKSAGFASLEAALDERFERIAPAMALPGDVIALPTETALSALAIRISNNAVLHVFEEECFAVSQPVQFNGAWRVPCLTRAK